MTTAALTEELRLVEEDLARLRKTAVDLRRRIGDRDEEPTDAAERSALIQAAEEQEALIDQLEARREQLLRRLGRPTGADRESHRLRGLQLRVLLSRDGLTDRDGAETIDSAWLEVGAAIVHVQVRAVRGTRPLS
jgi:hypothetical protein